MQMGPCQACGDRQIREIIDLGRHAFSTGYLHRPDQTARNFPLSLVQCLGCGLIQLSTPALSQHLRPLFDWVTFREPEQHLDDVCQKLLALDGLTRRNVAVLGITSKDDTTLTRLNALGFEKTYRLDLVKDLGVSEPLANVEAVPDALTTAQGAMIAAKHGEASLVVVRHIFEHAANLDGFIRGLAALVSAGGYLMVEIPDSSRSLLSYDYTMIWEEHSVYFTPATFFSALARYGFETVLELQYPYSYEDCLVLVARKTGRASPSVASALSQQIALAENYGRQFRPTTEEIKRRLIEARQHRPVAVYGAGHLSASFINYHGLADLIDCVVDDTPQKLGLFMPGSRISILPSQALIDRGIGLCLLGLSPEVEPKVIERNQGFLAAGGVFKSLLAASPRAFLAAD